MKSGVEFFYFEIPLAPSEILLTCQANSAFLGRFFAMGSSNSEGPGRISK